MSPISPRTIIIMLMLFIGSAAFAQGTPESATDPNAAPAARQPNGASNRHSANREVSDNKQPDTAGMQARSKQDSAALGNVGSAGLNQRVLPPAALAPELLVRARSIAVVSETFWVKKEELEKGLVNRKELEQLGLHVSQEKDKADLVLRVRRAPFQNNFPFTITDRATGVIVMGGMVNSLLGTVPGKIAGRIADKLKEIYSVPEWQRGPLHQNDASPFPSGSEGTL